jgi:Rrf2 family protein
MSQVFKLSEASTIAFHAMTMLAAFPERMIHAREMAQTFKVSEAHLAKVMQRLAHAGLVKATRGPRGGFALARPAAEINLLAVFEAVEGPLEEHNCLLDRPVCAPGHCIMGKLLPDLNRQIRTYLNHATLDRLVAAYGGTEK